MPVNYASSGLESPIDVYVDTVHTPTGEEIVQHGWDTEPTIIRAVDPALLELCSGRNRTTTKFKAVRPDND